MTIVVVERLELIDVDEQQREWAARAVGLLPFLAQRFVKGSPVAQPRERVGTRQVPQFRFRKLSPHQFSRQQERAAPKDRSEHCHHDPESPGAALPLSVNVALGRRNVDNDWKPRRVPVDVESTNPID